MKWWTRTTSRTSTSKKDPLLSKNNKLRSVRNPERKRKKTKNKILAINMKMWPTDYSIRSSSTSNAKIVNSPKVGYPLWKPGLSQKYDSSHKINIPIQFHFILTFEEYMLFTWLTALFSLLLENPLSRIVFNFSSYSNYLFFSFLGDIDLYALRTAPLTPFLFW